MEKQSVLSFFFFFFFFIGFSSSDGEALTSNWIWCIVSNKRGCDSVDQRAEISASHSQRRVTVGHRRSCWLLPCVLCCSSLANPKGRMIFAAVIDRPTLVHQISKCFIWHADIYMSLRLFYYAHRSNVTEIARDKTIKLFWLYVCIMAGCLRHFPLKLSFLICRFHMFNLAF